MKKIFTRTGIVIGTAGLIIAGAAAFSAFEAHVINVTARIENALFVHPEALEFGTVFPQEHLLRAFFVTFSESFTAAGQNRAGNIDYDVRQKPKPRPEFVEEVGVLAARDHCHDNWPPVNVGDPDDPYYEDCYPLLCPYISKHPEADEDPITPGLQSNDQGVLAFHDPFDPANFAKGRIEKFGIDVGDTWVVDLAVPCFQGQCAQDWPAFVLGLNPDAGDPSQYELPPGLESEVFGCDLWVEVTDIEEGD